MDTSPALHLSQVRADGGFVGANVNIILKKNGSNRLLLSHFFAAKLCSHSCSRLKITVFKVSIQLLFSRFFLAFSRIKDFPPYFLLQITVFQ